MTRLLSSRELRFLSSGGGVAFGIALSFLAFWYSPWSPMALGRPASLVAAGDPAAGAAAFGALGRGWGPEATRREALWKAVQLTLVELDQPGPGAELLREYVSAFPEAPNAAEAWSRLAEVYAWSMDDGLRAAEAWEKAARVAPESPDAPRWLLQAGRALAEAEQGAHAEDLLVEATASPSVALEAWVALGRARLSADPAGAYEAYAMAQGLAATEAEAGIARLGMGAALDRLDAGDGAYAEVEGAAARVEADEAIERMRQRSAR